MQEVNEKDADQNCQATQADVNLFSLRKLAHAINRDFLTIKNGKFSAEKF